MFGKSAIVCDRRVYAFKGKWIKPKEDYEESIFYFVSRPETLVNVYKNGRETVEPQIEITVFGGKEFCDRDTIILQDGSKWRIEGTPAINYLENNIMVRDMLKQRIESTTLILR